MRIDEIIKNKRTLSFEVFPPKNNESDELEKIFRTIDRLKEFNPDFISVTYGAGGSNRVSNAEIAGYIKKLGIEPLAHLTGGPSTKEEIDKITKNLKANDVENILALRGDKPAYMSEDFEYCKTFKHATDLIEYINKDDFSIAGACYPEGHTESKTLYEDLKYMKMKEDMGAKFFITQIFYDNEYYYRLVNEARRMGIKSPIIPGVMPILSASSIDRIKTMCGSTIPLDLRNMLEIYRDNKEIMKEFGINYAVYQIMDLIAKGAPGVHIYVMNNSKTAKEIYERLGNIFKELF